jgi:hypothetical protein
LPLWVLFIDGDSFRTIPAALAAAHEIREHREHET